MSAATPTLDPSARATVNQVRVGDLITVTAAPGDVYYLTVTKVIAKGQAAVTIVATNPDAPVMEGNVRSRRYWASTHRRTSTIAKAYGRGVAIYPANG